MNHQFNATKYGFVVKEVTTLPYLEADYYLMEHEKTKAQLIYLKRDDRNKTFAICMKTIPNDDTGVFHILEHGVLGGSRKYPVKEPFVELLKSSMNTFLNAMTFPDKTLYPVSSQNDKDFMNLVSVYMDAVFDPAIYFNKNIFLQEGWHYDLLDAKENPTYKGVVYNEMKGVYSNVDGYLDLGMNRLLFSDTCYQYESGGDPKSIPNLTYEQYLNTHREFYAMSNARFIVDGDVDIEAILELINQYASKEDYRDCDHKIEIQKQKTNLYQEIRYPIEADADIENATMIQFGKIVSTYDQLEKNYAYKILCNYLAGNNDSCLKKVLLEKNLCKDVYLDLYDGIMQPFLSLSIRYTNESKKDMIQKVIVDEIKHVLDQRLDYEMIEASLSFLEFKVKERGNSAYPEGVLLAMSMMESWNYDGDPKLYLDLDGIFKNLRQRLKEGYFEQLLQTILDELEYVAVLVAKPSPTLAYELEKQEADQLEAIKASWTQNQTQFYLEENKQLMAFQTAVDSKEALSQMPTLTLQDIDTSIDLYPYTTNLVEDVPFRHYHFKQQGVVYLHLFFKLSHFSAKELSAISLLCQMYTELPTEKYGVTELSKKMKATFGAFSTDLLSFSPQGKDDQTNLYFVVKCSFLEDHDDKAYALLHEIIYHTQFKHQGLIKDLIKQNEHYIKEAIMNNGHRYGMMRAQATQTQKGYIAEMTGGYAFYEYLKGLDYNTDFTCIEAKIRKQLNKSNLEVSYHGHLNEATLLKVIAEGDKNSDYTNYTLLPIKDEKIPFPMQVGYAALAFNLYKNQYSYTNQLKVFSKIVSLEYLWNEIRVKGGAYGTGMTVGVLGDVGFYSYRDPSPRTSIQLMKDTSTFIQHFNQPLDRYIIATLADETVLSTALKLNLADAYYFIGIDDDMRQQMRKDLLNTTLADLVHLSKNIASILETSPTCIIGKVDSDE